MLKKSTIYDIATSAQTSAATVSAVLNGTWEQRRISPKTAKRIQELAHLKKYTLNRQASGLRKQRSGLIGMVIPTHDNRFFGSLSQTFERMARERHLHPIVVSTLRDPELEVDTVKALISYQVEYLLVTGATGADAISRVCQHHGIPHVYVDLPGSKAPSIVSDNYWGAMQLTERIIERSRTHRSKHRNTIYFIGGIPSDYATSRRIEGFSHVVNTAFGHVRPEQIITRGYEPERAEEELQTLYTTLGGLPRGLFVNSTIALEGAVRFLKTLPAEELLHCSIGSYDWDPFASFLSFPLVMVKQDTDGLIGNAFEIIDNGVFEAGKLIEVRPEVLLST